jgi:hypothetical protein
MKKTILSIVMLTTFSAFSQTSVAFKIEHCKDNMTDKEYYFAEKKLICANDAKTKGFTITPNFKAKDGGFDNNGFLCKNVNIGTCDENDSLIFLFEDSSKITLSMWNKFNCEGNVYVDFSSEELELLKTKKVTAIRFSNGRSYDTLTYNLKPSEQDYFIRAYTNFQIVEVDCSK